MNKKLSNLSYLNEVTDGNTELLIEIMDIFLEQINEFTEETIRCRDNKDWYKLGAIMHKAKSSIKSFCASDTAHIVEEIESLAKENLNKKQLSEHKNIEDTSSMELKTEDNNIPLEKINKLVDTFISHCKILKKEVSDYKKELEVHTLDTKLKI